MNTSVVALPAPSPLLSVHALCAFERIDIRSLARQSEMWLASSPATLRLEDGGTAVCLRYGVVVFIGSTLSVRTGFLDLLESWGNARLSGNAESEELSVAVDPEGGDRCYGGRFFLTDASVQRLQLLGEVVARSVIMATYEEALKNVAAAVEPLANELARHGRSRQSSQSLLRQIGEALRIRQALVGRAEVLEKPELLWERPDLERLYHQFMDELEITERNAALSAKLSLITDAAHTALDLVQQSKSLRVEWYIVALILVEIALGLIRSQ